MRSNARPTQRAVDWRESARFTSIFLALGFFCSHAFSQPARQPLTQTVSPPLQNDELKKAKMG